MSLVGSLEDLGLGDILQIVSLSRKSGLLLLRSEDGEGRIVFCDGLVRAAFVKGEAEDLRVLLLSGGFIEAEDYDRAAEIAAAHGDPVADVLADLPNLSKERLDSLRREQVERSVFGMFGWKVGEFSFEIRDEIDDRDRELLLPTGINAQYLTMEATRLGDEVGKDGDDDLQFGTIDDGGASDDGPANDFAPTAAVAEESTEIPDEITAELPESGDAEMWSAEDVTDSTEALALAVAQRVDEPAEAVMMELEEDEPAELESEVVVEPEAPPSFEAVSEPVASTDEPALSEGGQPPPKQTLEPTESVAPAAARTGSEPSQEAVADTLAPKSGLTALIIIDPELAALEWQKSVLGPICRRVHIFQRAENGIARIRQYLRRGESPFVMVSADVPADPVSGIADSLGLVRRLRGHAPGMQIFLVCAGDDTAPTDTGVANGVFERPANHQLANRRAWSKLEGAGASMRDALLATLTQDSQQPADSAPSPDAASAVPSATWPVSDLQRLKSMSVRLRDPSVRGEVLSLILEFAAESFSRVAIFMVRDDEAVGMAQAGLECAGGPDDEAFREITLAARTPGWFRAVLDRREGVAGPPSDAGDHELAELIGSGVAPEAYVAPIESNQRVVALVYCDNLPGGRPIGETTSLEIILHEAGLALERALLERALADAAEPSGA